MSVEHTPIVIAVAVLVCVFCQWLAWRVKLPAILFLLLAGILSGPVLQIFNPEQLMGHLFFPFVSLSVAIILFEGSITLKFKEIIGLEAVVRNMLTFGLLITWFITAAAARYIVGISWELAFLFGALTVVTGPTVIAPLLRAVRPTTAIANILRWEGIVIDPIGASLAVLVYEFIISESYQQAWGQTVLTFLAIIIFGVCIGAATGYLYGLALRNRLVPEFLQSVATLAIIFVSFSVANILQAESGLVAVTVLGMWLANMRGVELVEIHRFKENLSILLISLLFLMLTARIDLMEMQAVGWAAFFLFLIVQFIARPLNVLASSLGSPLSMRERWFLSWIAPRGIVAAAITSLFALKLEKLGLAEAQLLVPLAFSIIIGTVFLQSMTALPLARRLGVAEPNPAGFLIIGANRVARAIGAALKQKNIRVLLADTDWEKIHAARKEGLEVYYGSPLSEHADRHLDLTGIGTLLALSPYEGVNIASALRFRQEFGRNNIYTIVNTDIQGPLPANRPFPKYATTLFGPEVTFGVLASLLEAGASLSEVSMEYYMEHYIPSKDTQAVPLFMVGPDGQVAFFTSDERETAKPETSIVVLKNCFDTP